MPAADDKPIHSFVDVTAFRAWLAVHHGDHSGIWLRYFKKASAQTTIVHVEAVQEALCWGMD